MPTTNYYIGKEDGWVQLADAPDFVRVSGYPHTHPYYLYAGSAAPSLTPEAATGDVIFGGLPSNDQEVTIGSETYTFKTIPKATGQVIFSGVPTADQTVTVGSETYVFKALAGNPFEVTIGGDETTTGDNFVTAVTADSTLITAVNAAGTVTITSILAGSGGNYALATNADNTAVSGAAMTGGSDITAAFQVGIGVDATSTGDFFEACVNSFSTLVTAENAAGTVTVTAIAAGTQGNYALTENADNTTVSGATMTGGANIAEGVLMCHHPFVVNVTMTEKLYGRIAVPVANANKNDGKIRLDVFTVV